MDFWEVIYENVEKKKFNSQHFEVFWHFEVL